MSNGDDAADSALQHEIKAVQARLVHARQTLGQDKIEFLNDIGPRLAVFTQRISNLSTIERRRMQPLLLALLDEVEQAIKVFQEGLACMRHDLTSANQSRVAGAAYHQLRKL